MACYFFGQTLHGQAIFEKSYYNYDVGGPTVYNIEGHGSFYVFLKSGGTIDFYNKNHSFYKTIQLSQVGNNSYSVVNISSQLINNGDQIEVIYYVINPPDYTTYIQDEEGGLIQSMEGISWVTWIEDDYKLVVSSIETAGKKDIYNLPGSIYTVISGRILEHEVLPYPNPTENIIYLPYNLEQGTMGSLIIYSSNGHQLEHFKLSGDFDDIQLDVGSYKPGVYIYTVFDQTGKTTSTKFVVR